MSAAALAALVKGPGYFITGTDTDVGKTWVGCRLAAEARVKGRKVGVFKPAESGGAGDALALARASGCDLPLEVIRPYLFRAPLAPLEAARREGRRISLETIRQRFAQVKAASDFTLVEGAGGLLVPYGHGINGASLAKALGLPLLVVARARLGTINHTLLTLEAARSRGLKVAAVVMNGRFDPTDVSFKDNARQVAKLGRVKVLGPLAWEESEA